LFYARLPILPRTISAKKATSISESRFTFSIQFYTGDGVGVGGVGVTGAAGSAGGKVFNRNWSRMLALAGLLAAHYRLAAFWAGNQLFFRAIDSGKKFCGNVAQSERHDDAK
jgi:hypothetical protein